ncbi:MAG: hypothetical protein JRG72_11560 [Deltaproteobacteria bacterium]|nr:hypothetical protein [Deltaproteobacteria bacterium]
MEQTELITAIKQLLIMLVGFGVILGLIRVSRLPKILARILILPIILGMLYAAGHQWWVQLPAVQQQLVLIVLLPVALVILLRLVLGAELFREVLGNFIYDLLKNGFILLFNLTVGLFSLPIRLIRLLWRRWI